NVIIADDHPIVLFGIRKSLEQIEWVNVVGEFEDSTALINNLPACWAVYILTGQRAGAEHGPATVAVGSLIAAIIFVPIGAVQAG
ncbi:hypothetical protein MJL79_30565, partial [Salmonella enterica subsp. enterica serovar Montevideo]|nr:hypothetical protein [Salmonella enterica subsp. enterica serovar Montevideo]